MKDSKQMYPFCTLPYFIEFWKQKVINYSGEFSGKQHLSNKGLALIEKTDFKKKIKT